MARVDHTGSAGTSRAARTLPPEILAPWSAAIARARLRHHPPPGPCRLMATVGVPNYTKLVG